MVQISKNHHFVSRCYLAGFTDTGTKDGRLCVFDFMAARFFVQKPRNVAFEPDFNRVDIKGHTPDVLEEAFGQFEARTALVIRQITTEEDIPEDEEFSYVLNLISLFAVRNPATRRSMSVARRHECRVIGDLVASDKMVYEHPIQKARASGFLSGKDVPYEKLRDFLRRDAYEIEIPPHDHLVRELAIFQNILALVSSRNWSLLIAPADAPDFMTCDHPISLLYKQLLFPLDARHALMGDRKRGAPRRMHLSAAGVAETNLRMWKLADRQIYSRTPDVALLSDDRVVSLPLNKIRRPA
jgi:hypothetical protein